MSFRGRNYKCREAVPEPPWWLVHWELLAAMVIGAGVVAGLAAAMLFGPGGPLEPGEWSWF